MQPMFLLSSQKAAIAASLFLLGCGAAWFMGGAAGVAALMLAAAAIGVFAIGIRSARFMLAVVALALVAGQLVRVPVAEGADSSILAIDLALGLFVVGGGVMAALRRLPFPMTRSVAFLLAFCCWLPVPLALNAHLLSSRELLLAGLYAMRFLFLAGAFVVAAWLVRTPGDRRQLATALGYAATALVGLGFVQRVLLPDIGFLAAYGWDPHQNRLLSTFVDPNFFGMFLVMVHTVLLAAVLDAKQRRPFLIGLLAAVLLAIVLTLSRSTYLALVVASSVVLLIRSWRSWVVLAVCFALALGANPTVRARIADAFALDDTSRFRIQSWVETLEVAERAPLVGVGYNALGPARIRLGYLTDLTGHSAQGSDSSLILIFVTTGLVGLALYVAFLGSLLIECWAVWRRDKDPLARLAALALLGIVPAYVVDSQFVNGLLYPLLLVPFSLLAGPVAARTGRARTLPGR